MKRTPPPKPHKGYRVQYYNSSGRLLLTEGPVSSVAKAISNAEAQLAYSKTVEPFPTYCSYKVILVS